MELKLHPRQSEAFLSPATEILYGGAAAGGKSYLMRAKAIAVCVGVPGAQVFLVRKNLSDLNRNHIESNGGFRELLAPWIRCGAARITGGGPWEISFVNGSKIWMDQVERYSDVVTKYQGAEITLLLPDELTQLEERVYRYLRARVRLGGLGVPPEWEGRLPQVLASANPGGVGHNWVKATWISPQPAGEIWEPPPDEGGMSRQFIPAKLKDNPTALANDPDYVKRLQGLGDPALVRAMLEGDWDIVAGGMFDDVWSERSHVLNPFSIPDTWLVDRSFDWGSAKPFSVGWWAESDDSPAKLGDGVERNFPKGTLFRIAEWYGWNGRSNEGCRMVDSEIAAGILRRETELGIAGRVKAGPADSSIFDEVNADSPAAIQQRHGVRWERADKGPGSRKRGWEALRRRLKASLEPRMEEPGLFVFDTCRHFIRTVPVLPRDERDRDDVDTNSEDHIGDETRYRVQHKRNSVTTGQSWY